MTIDEMTDHIVTTNSVNSTVYEKGSDTTFADVHNGDAEPWGHIMLLDYDECSERQAKQRLEDKPGITLILKSSPGSHHVWNLCVQPKADVVQSMVLLRDDYSHVRSGIKRGYWRLRIGPKVREGGDTYKERPELVAVLFNETDRVQSKAHWRLARALYDIPPLPDAIREWVEWKGESHTVERYATLTDEAKEAWPDDD